MVDRRRFRARLATPAVALPRRSVVLVAALVLAAVSSGFAFGAADPGTGNRTFAYDTLGRLTSVTAGATTTSYSLDGAGNRWSQTTGPTTTSFELDLAAGPATILADGTNTYLPGAPNAGHETGATWSNALTDLVGSPIGSVDTAGTMSAAVHYDPFGAPRPGSSVGVGIGYGGEYRDASGLLNLRARSYDPALGRFLGRDTFGGLALAPQTANRYAYALANPLRYRDPSGHFVTNIVANPRAWLGIASLANPWVAIGLGLYIADTGYDPVFNATVSPEGRTVAGISSLLGVAGQLGSRFMEAWRATETGAAVLTASERLLLAETSIQRASRLGSEGGRRRQVDYVWVS